MISSPFFEGGGGLGGGAEDFSEGGLGGARGEGWGLGSPDILVGSPDNLGGRAGRAGDLDSSTLTSGLPNEERAAGIGDFRISTTLS